jgi:hypothetical protein
MSTKSNIESLQIYFDKVIKDLKGDQVSKGIKATGDSAASLKYKAEELKGTLTGSNYFYWQIVGRRPGKFAPPDAILQWMADKGIKPNNPKTSLKSLAYLINRKIATKGTDIYTGKREGLSFQDITGGENYEEMINNLKERKVAEVLSFMKAELTGKPQNVQ